MARRLGLDRRTVRKFARATTVDELLAKATGRSDLLTPFQPYLLDRFRDGCTDAARLTRDQGSGIPRQPVDRPPVPAALPRHAAAAQAPAAPTVRQVTG
ncbi:hypothetical protein [Nonomuraea dietziae]|uniref:hypothetical protein n=1 Tax=Nonomuraea dietziae TaxID=65515 RepID=UPI0033C383A7